MPDWADEKARELCEKRIWMCHDDGPCARCVEISAALREAREQGAREERRACYTAVRDDYRAKAIQRQRDFDAAAHACDVLQGKLDKAVEERDAALVLYKAILPSALSWCQRVPQVPVREAVAARELLRERGLLVGERG